MNVKRKVIGFYKLFHSVTGKETIHFIHIGKTAGTAIRSAFAAKSSLTGNVVPIHNKLFIMHGHDFTLDKVKPGQKVFFVVRDPVSRFISGFNSRLRKGMPKNHNPWSKEEEFAFNLFKTPNELGEALSDPNKETRNSAVRAMKGIGHVRSSYWDWIGDSTYLKKNKDKIIRVLRQEHLSSDFHHFSLEAELNFDLPQNNVLQSHKTPTGFYKSLSKKAHLNLKEWYKVDYEFLDLLHELGFLPEKY